MKKCPWCGKEYPDEVTLCASDHNVLEPVDPTKPAPEAFEPVPEDELPWQTDVAPAEEAGDPNEFVLMGTMDPQAADDLLSKFEAQEIPFKIDRVDEQIQNRGGVRTIGYIQIFVRRSDKPAAFKIYTADWKV